MTEGSTPTKGDQPAVDIDEAVATADPVLQPKVKEARDALSRLTAEGKRPAT